MFQFTSRVDIEKILYKIHMLVKPMSSLDMSACAQFSNELIYVLQFSQHFEATKLRAPET